MKQKKQENIKFSLKPKRFGQPSELTMFCSGIMQASLKSADDVEGRRLFLFERFPGEL